MNMIARPVLPPEMFPDSDGKPMSENTRQYEAIVTLKGNVEAFAPADAFVAGDHLIYADPTDPAERQAPDVYVAFGRPQGHRGSYKLWEEGDVFPQVIFEVLGPSNTRDEMREKRGWYFAHGAEEYYEFDPEAGMWEGYVRNAGHEQPEAVPNMDGHESARLGMKFGFRPMELVAFRPDGSRFLSFQELNDLAEQQGARAEAAIRWAEAATDRADANARRADAEGRRADAQAQRADALERQVGALGGQVSALERLLEAEAQRADTQAQQSAADAKRAADAEARLERLRQKLRNAGLDPDANGV